MTSRPRQRHAALIAALLAVTVLAGPARSGKVSNLLNDTNRLVGSTVNTVLNAPASLLSSVGKTTVTLLSGAPENGDLRHGVSVQIDGARGGVAQVGRFKVVVPAGAWQGTATVSINVPDPSVAQCSLDIAGVPNSFATPVTLVIDTSNTGATDAGVVWFDPGTGKWYLLAGNGSSEMASVALRHFSSYGAVGSKAGW